MRHFKEFIQWFRGILNLNLSKISEIAKETFFQSIFSCFLFCDFEPKIF